MSITTDSLRDALRQVIDPEVGLNIVDLGLVYRLAILDTSVQLDLTMTSPACPMGEGILDEAVLALKARIPASWIVEAQLVWEPAWTPARMGEKARLRFGWDQ
ncbi:metal-sulfur cluster assembly factor [Uliginosibacterium flavum]|uniref:Metal-sulfur cluster assembly factor n=1 Tax=Uliginosibacterium flavum TaxID=1396831 RepID=A0ABV2TQ06_9RHOO